MTNFRIDSPLRFQPIFMERIWGGRRLETLFDKQLPPGVRIGESWEIVDRPEAQSIVADGELAGKTLHELWTEYRPEIFGAVNGDDRFPLLLKILDAEERLSLQVHPPEKIAREFGGEAKTELWYVAEAKSGAEIFVGTRNDCSRALFEAALAQGKTEEHLHRLPVTAGDAMFLPSGRMHAIGAGNVIIEVQQNSDTTYRVFDWNRLEEHGLARELHVERALHAIDFGDHEPALLRPIGESLVRHELFEVEKWMLTGPREASEHGSFAIVICLSGVMECAGITFKAGDFFLLPAGLRRRELIPQTEGISLLRVTIPRRV